MTVTGMLASGLHYFPVTLPFLLALMGLLGLVVGMAALRVLRYASISMGIGVENLLAILSLSLLGATSTFRSRICLNGRPPPPPRSVTSASRT